MLRSFFFFGLFLSACLLFSIQPMVAKVLLPVYGGTPAVWTLCMLFFQFLLLAAYGYVWLLSYCKKPWVWRAIHLSLIALSLVTIPLSLHPTATEGYPEWAIFISLLTQLGLPLLVVGASAPLLQFAYSQTREKGAVDPYFLYIASNLGSLLALLLYPWLVERYIGLAQQFYLWNIAYVVYLSVLALLFFIGTYRPLENTDKASYNLPWRQMAIWIMLSFIPCSMMLSVTLYISTDVAATPLFWVMPLSLYLLSFVLTFTSKPLISHSWVTRNCLFFLTFTLIGFILGVNQVKAWQLALFNLSSFFILALLCHGELFRKRPQSQLLTLFYFCLAIGGVLAGLFNGILAPHWFNNVYEYPIAILLSLFALPKTTLTKGWWTPPVVLGLLLLHYLLPNSSFLPTVTFFQIIAFVVVVILVVFQQSNLSRFLSMGILFVFIFSPLTQKNDLLLQQRNFYGVKQVQDRQGVHALISHSTVHGLQLADEKRPPNGFRSYYGAIESVVRLMQAQRPSMAVTIMGLGTGTMICQHRHNDKVQVIEIDPQMISLALNDRLFTYLRDCDAKAELIKNDGRLALAKLPDESQDLLILDAFTSDAIPVHLMTLQAFSLYQKKLKEDGVILVNISNRHIDLLPILNAIGRALDLVVLHVNHQGVAKLGQFDSEWVLLSSNENLVFSVMSRTNWRFVSDDKGYLWTDDYSNIIPLIKW